MLAPVGSVGWKGITLRLGIAAVLVVSACAVEVNVAVVPGDSDETTTDAGTDPVQIVELPAASEDVPESPPPSPVRSDGPPDAAQAVEGLQRESTVSDWNASGRGEAPYEGPVEPASPEGGPVFTPFTHAPSLTNRAEIGAALSREYPPLLRDAGVGGKVTVWFYIDAEGTVSDLRIAGSSGHTALDEAALRVARVMQFTPAMNRSDNVPVWVQIPITFGVR